MSSKQNPRAENNESREPDLDRLIYTPRRNDIHDLLWIALPITRPIRLCIARRLGSGLSPPCKTCDKMRMRLDGLDASTGCQLPHSDSIVIGCR